MRSWCRLLRNPLSKLHGFDSFEGLPESWELAIEKGRFATGGSIPVVDDPRVQFFKGWFSDTLPEYILPAHKCLFVNFDADIYSSTKTVLDFIEPHVALGTYFYFDEFQSREHEMKAFDEFLSTTGHSFRCIAADRGLNRVLFQCIGRHCHGQPLQHTSSGAYSPR